MNVCPRYEDDILLAVDGSLPDRDLVALEAHAVNCAGCARALAGARAIEAQLARLDIPPLTIEEIEAHVGLVREKVAAGRERVLTPRPRTRRLTTARLAAAAAVLALLAAALGYGLFRGEMLPHPQIVDLAPGVTVPGVTAPTDPAPHGPGPHDIAPQPDDVLPQRGDMDSPRIDGEPAVVEVREPEVRVADADARTTRERPTADEAQRDAERLALARRSVATALTEAVLNEGVEPQAFATDVDMRVGELVRGDWPIVRIAESFVREDDVELARRSLRYLAARGDNLSVGSVRTATRRPELASAAWRALARVQPDRVDLLVSEPAARAAADQALSAIVERGGTRGAEAIEDALRRIDPESQLIDAERTRTLLDALAEIGPDAIPGLLRLAEQERPSRAQAVEALAKTRGAAQQLMSIVREPRPSVGAETLLAAFARIPPTGVRADEAFAWIAARAGEPRTHLQALRTLARCGSPAALAVLVQIGARDPDPALDTALAALLTLRPECAVELARGNDASGRKRDQQLLLETLSTVELPCAIPGLVALSDSTLLDLGDRRLALLACGVEGNQDDAERLVDTFAHTRERELRAAILVALQALGGADAVDRLLGDLNERSARSIREILADPELDHGGVHAQARVARELSRHMAAIRP